MSAARKFKRRKEQFVKIKLSQLVSSAESLGRLGGQPLPARQAFLLGKTLKAVNSELESYNATRLETCKRFGTEDKKKGQFEIPEENLEAFNKEFQDLLNTEVELNVDKLKLADLGNANLSGSDVVVLDWLIEE